MTRILLEHGLEVDNMNHYGETPLHLACRGVPVPGLPAKSLSFWKADYYAVVQLLLEKGASAEGWNHWQVGASVYPHDSGIVKLLRDHERTKSSTTSMSPDTISRATGS